MLDGKPALALTTTSDTWKGFMDSMEKKLDERYHGQCVWIFVDNLGIHRNLEVVRRFYSKNYHFVFLPPNSTHFMAPLDDVLFANLRKFLNKEMIVGTRSSWSETLSNRLKASVGKCIKKSFTPTLIKAAFLHTGIEPWAPEVQKSRADDNSHVSAMDAGMSCTYW
jgi:hypothetical protein